MKIVGIISAIILIGFAVVQGFAYSTQSGIEGYPFKVVKTYDDFEIRNYEASLFTSVKLSTNKYEEASGQGFKILAGYIFGGNERNEKIAMTTPVAMSLEDSMTMMFLVPKSHTRESLPKPNQSNVEFKEEPAKTVAAVTFGGWADSAKIEQYKNQLIAALEKEDIAFTNKFYFLGYNPPFDLVGRRNEVIVELTEI
jgi:hypothetical protein